MNIRFLLIYGSIFVLVVLRVVLTPPAPDLPNGAHLQADVRLTSTPQIISQHQQFQVHVRGQNVTIITSQFADFTYGDVLRINGTLKRKVLDNKKIVYSIYFPSIQILRSDVAVPYKVAGFVRKQVKKSFASYLSSEQSGLLMGIVFGINQGVDKDVKTAFQVTGVTHVIAASGMNVTLLAAFLLPLLKTFFKRQTSLVFLLFILTFYCVLSGMSASIVRATLMASIGVIGLLLGRQRTAFISFFLTGCIMIWVSPAILGDIGFQLSFAATAGMLLVRPLLPSLSRLPFIKLVEEDLAATIAAQLTTLPILIYYFHSFGLLGILVNTLVLWTVAPMMMIGSIAAFVALVSTQLGGLIAFLSLPFLIYFLGIVQLFASFTPIVTVTRLPVTILFGYYLLLFALIWWFHKRNSSQL